jgi:hypothetical protein
MSHPNPQHDPENVRIEDDPYAPTQAHDEGRSPRRPDSQRRQTKMSTHDENFAAADRAYENSTDAYIDIAHPAKFHNPRLSWRDIAAAKHAEARRAASARRKAHPPSQSHPEVWVVCDCGGNGWHLGRVGSRICEAGCAGAGRRFVGERITDDQE